jgi:DNA-binding response OmpR family regulator
MMPGVSGWEVAAALLADRATDYIPFIFITARAAISDRIRAFEAGAQDYLTKPFDPGQLAETINTVLEQIEHGEREANIAETLLALKAEQALALERRTLASHEAKNEMCT